MSTQTEDLATLGQEQHIGPELFSGVHTHPLAPEYVSNERPSWTYVQLHNRLPEGKTCCQVIQGYLIDTHSAVWSNTREMEETDKQREEREWEEALESLFSGEQQNDSLHTPERQEKSESTPWWLTEESLLGEVELDYTGEDPKDGSFTPSQTAAQQRGVTKLDQADPASRPLSRLR